MTKPGKEQLESELASAYDASEIQAIWRWIASEDIVPDNLMDRLRKHEPIQYIYGYAWFYKRKFLVTRDTLIPRPETEELCSIILADMGKEALQILDVGTGSGCIAVALCAENNHCKATALDISSDAIAVARANAALHGVGNRIAFVTTDFLTNTITSDSFDIIVSNPPYISIDEKAGLHPGVVEWEPHDALFPHHADPLVFYKKLALLLGKQKRHCTLYAEINAALANETLALFADFNHAELIKDWSGNNRFLRIKKEGI